MKRGFWLMDIRIYVIFSLLHRWKTFQAQQNASI